MGPRYDPVDVTNGGILLAVQTVANPNSSIPTPRHDKSLGGFCFKLKGHAFYSLRPFLEYANVNYL